MQKITYTIGVHMGLFRGMRAFKVHAHRLESIGTAGTLVLNLTNGTELHVPDIGHKEWRVYPDYQAEQERIAAVQAEINHQAQAGARLIVQQQQHEQLAALNAQRMRAVPGAHMPQVPIQQG